MEHSLHATTFVGRRANNEDAIFHWHGIVDAVPVSIIAVADGMGGEAAGEVASAIAVDLLEKAWDSYPRDAVGDGVTLREFIKKTYSEIGIAIREKVGKEPSLRGMGTTLVCAFVVGRRGLVSNVGDSRAYLSTPKTFQQLTEDHSVVADSLRRGIMTVKEAETSPYRHALTHSLDGEGSGDCDIFPDSGWLELPDGGVLLACSDGLFGVLQATKMKAVLCEEALTDAVEELVAQAYENGSQDNISLAAIEIGSRIRSASGRGPRRRSLSGRRDDVPRGVSRNRLRVLILAVSLLLVSASFAWSLRNRWRNEKSDGRLALLTLSPDTVFSVPFSERDHVSWRLLGDTSETFNVWFYRYRASSASDYEDSLQYAVFQDTVLSLRGATARKPWFFSPGIIEWEVRALMGEHLVTSTRSRIHLYSHNE